MNTRTWQARLLALLAAFVAAVAAWTPSANAAQDPDLLAFDGDWLYVEDRTEGRSVEEQGPPMSAKLRLRVEEDAVVWVRSSAEERVTIDGSVIEEDRETAFTQRSGAWKDGVLHYDVETVRKSDAARLMLIHREFRVTPDGLEVRVVLNPPTEVEQVAVYRHPQDIALPEPAEATIDDMEWLAGAWVGARGTRSIEERWSPPLGGAMLGVSRTVSRGSMTAFEYLRIVERDGGLVYVAQPGGAPPTEFVLTELGSAVAVFVNPRHDHPQRIVYELSAEGSLSASIGFAKGGRLQRFEFTREGD